MPRTAESIVDSFHAASERRTAGRPIWDQKIDVSGVFHNDEMTFEQRRDAIVRRFQSSAWHRDSETVQSLVEELGDTRDADEFDGPWDALYDEADYDRVWINTL